MFLSSSSSNFRSLRGAASHSFLTKSQRALMGAIFWYQYHLYKIPLHGQNLLGYLSLDISLDYNHFVVLHSHDLCIYLSLDISIQEACLWCFFFFSPYLNSLTSGSNRRPLGSKHGACPVANVEKWNVSLRHDSNLGPWKIWSSNRPRPPKGTPTRDLIVLLLLTNTYK